MSQVELFARNLTEAELYLQASACPSCGSGPLSSVHVEDRVGSDGATVRSEIGLCASCGAEATVVLRIPGGIAQVSEIEEGVHPGDEPSRIIDVGQWLALAGMFRERASRAEDARIARRWNLRAVDCLVEALKFYDDPENDLPPAEAIFCEATRERFRAEPRQFSRRRILHEKSKLPSATYRGESSKS